MKRLLAVGALLIAACSATSSASDYYQLGEFFISGPTALAQGTSQISVENSGEFPHTLVVSTPDGTVVTATDLVMPGETATLDFELAPGTYQFTCRIVGEGPDGELVDHYERGMHATVAVKD